MRTYNYIRYNCLDTRPMFTKGDVKEKKNSIISENLRELAHINGGRTG